MLPLEPQPTLTEEPHLTGDQLVELGALEPVEISVVDESALVEPDEPNERPVSLDTHAFRQRVGNAASQPRVVGLQKILAPSV